MVSAQAFFFFAVFGFFFSDAFLPFRAALSCRRSLAASFAASASAAAFAAFLSLVAAAFAAAACRRFAFSCSLAVRATTSFLVSAVLEKPFQANVESV